MSIIIVMSAVYKLYETDRCYGDVATRETITKTFVLENKNMSKLVNFIKLSTAHDKTFVIEKYINDDIRWRQLIVAWGTHERPCSAWNVYDTCNHWVSNIEKGDLTTTWEKYVWCPTRMEWKQTNYRYDDEIVVHSVALDRYKTRSICMPK